MRRNPPPENTVLTLAVAVGIAVVSAALGWIEGVFARLSPETVVALAVFAVGFALATYLCDRQVRSLVDGLLGELERRYLARGGSKREPPVPALEVRPRLARNGQAQPAVGGAPDHDVGSAETAAR